MPPCKTALAAALGRAMWGCFALVAALPAAAQETAPEAQAVQDAKVLDAVTVTAQSRQQEIQDVPIALQVVDRKLIEDLGAEDLGDVDDFVPGLVVDSRQPTQPRLELRGISTGDFGIGTDPAVGVYVDGVYAGRGGGVLLPFTDVERIEVLKGPQGTLFGRNTAAGAISIVSHRPSNREEASATVRLGNDNTRYVQGMANLLAGEESALRLNVVYNDGDGWLRDAVTGEDLNPQHQWAGRIGFATKFGDDTRAWITWDHEELDQLGQATTGIVSLPDAPGLPALPVDESAYLDPRSTPTAVDVEGNKEARRFDGLTLIVDHAMDWAHLTSTTAWHDFDSLNRVEEDGTNRRYLYVDSANVESNRNVYQEFKLNGSNARVDWVAGASYYQESGHQDSVVDAYTDSVDTIVRNLGLAPTPDGSLFGFFSQVMQANGIPGSLLGNPWQETYTNTLDTTSYALFGDVIWHLTDKLNLTTGLRYTRDQKDFTWFNGPRSAPQLDATLDQLEAMGFFQAVGIPKEAFVFDVAFIDPVSLANKGVLNRSSKSWSDVSPRLVLDYHFTDDLMGYASLAKGYKAGGFNALQIGSQFDNEDVWNFEAGLKQALPQYRLQYNASAFYYVYDNRQAITLDMSTSIPRYVIDTSDLEAWGVDFDTRWQATDGLGLQFNAEYIDSTYKRYTNPVGIVLDGQPTGTPTWSMAAGLDYAWHLDSGELRLALHHAYRGATRCNDEAESQGTCGVSPALNLGEARNLTDLRLGWSAPQGRWGWAVYAHNLFDHQYVDGLATYGKTVLGTVGARVTDPRTYGVEVSARF
jgi:iron complex outermembrane receptor protein